ncbi:hypothetical protein QJQ45_004416 [Haematococcus lacustris]|nr:hypothetical protein QJQ45_004416 [Haematococcus lacustris]
MSLVAQCLRGSGPVPRSKIRFRLKARENESGELRAAHIASVHASAGPSVPPAKQREERRAEWKTQRRQVIKVPGGAVLRGCKKTKRKLMAHFQLMAGIHSQLRVIASLYVLRIFLTCLVGYSTPGYPSAPSPPAVQPPRALDAAPLPPLPLRVPAQPATLAMDWEPEPDPEPEPEPEPEPVPAPPTLRPPSARLAARHPPPAAPTGPPMPLDSEDPVLLQQLKVFCLYFANSNFLTPYNQLQRRLGRARQNKHFSIKPAFDDPSNQELLAKLQQLGSANFTERYVKLYAKAARARLGWSWEEAQLFTKLTCGYSLNSDSPELQAPHLDKAHVNDLMEEAAKQRRLLALEEGDSLQDTVPLPCRMRHAVHVCRCLEQWQQPPTPPVTGKPKRGGRRVGPRVLTCPPPFTLTPLARAGVHFVKVDSRVLCGVCQQLGLTRETEKAFTAEPARSNHWNRWFSTGKLANQGFEFGRTVETDGVSVCVHYTRPLPPPPAPPSAAGPSSSNSSPAAAPGAAAVAAHEVGLPRIGKGLAEQREFVFNPATQIGVGIDPGVTQAVSAASGVWAPATGQLQADQLRRWKLTKGEVKHGSGLNNARHNAERWLAPIKPHLQHLAAASSAGTSLEANLKHITVTLATWDATSVVMRVPLMRRAVITTALVALAAVATMGVLAQPVPPVPSPPTLAPRLSAPPLPLPELLPQPQLPSMPVTSLLITFYGLDLWSLVSSWNSSIQALLDVQPSLSLGALTAPGMCASNLFALNITALNNTSLTAQQLMPGLGYFASDVTQLLHGFLQDSSILVQVQDFCAGNYTLASFSQLLQQPCLALGAYHVEGPMPALVALAMLAEISLSLRLVAARDVFTVLLDVCLTLYPCLLPTDPDRLTGLTGPLRRLLPNCRGALTSKDTLGFFTLYAMPFQRCQAALLPAPSPPPPAPPPPTPPPSPSPPAPTP